MFKHLISCLLLCSLPLLAAPKHMANYDEAASQAKQQKLPYFVLIHGSSWHQTSKTFVDQLWSNDKILNSLGQDFIYTEIHIKQQLSKEQFQEEEKTRKTWKRPPLMGYPAIQLYSHDGKLLSQCKGKTLRNISTESGLKSYFRGSLAAITKRNLLLQQIEQANTDNKADLEIKFIGELASLPLRYDKKTILDQLRKLDPEDNTGWQERVSFDNWSYIRHISGLVRAKKTKEALKETNERLSKGFYSKEQRAFLLAAKGIIISSTGDNKTAWPYFIKAAELAPNNPDVEALYRHGERIAMLPLRAGFKKGSDLYGKNAGDNISRDHASFTMSSISHDDRTWHKTLFKGAYQGSAFHTGREKTAHIIVDLKDICTVNAVQILNVTNRNYVRAQTLTMSLSEDQQNWTKVWQAKEAKHDWQVLLDSPTKARYIKLALDSPHGEFLHLKGVNVFGKRP